VWYKNGQPVTSGITSPTIEVVKTSDGATLISETAMSQVGSTGIYKYDESTNRLTAGDVAIVTVTATIDGDTRTWSDVLGRDTAE